MTDESVRTDTSTGRGVAPGATAGPQGDLAPGRPAGGAAEIAEARRAVRRRWIGLAVACVGMMITFTTITANISALTSIQADLHLSSATELWVTSAYTLALSSLVLSSGTFGDLFGRRRTFLVGAAVMVAGSIGAFLSGTAGLLVASEAVIGVGGALVLPNSLMLVSHSFEDPHRRTEAISIWAACSGLGLAMGPIVAGALLDAFSWHSVFLLNILLGAVVLAATPVFVTESRGPSRGLDVPGLLLGTLTVAALTYGVIQGGQDGYTSGRIIGTFVLCAVALAALLVVESRRAQPMMDLSLFRSASFSGVMAVCVAAMFAFTGLALVMVLYFENVQTLSALGTGVRLLVWFGVYVAVSSVAGRIVRRIGFKIALTAGLCLAAVGSLLLLLAGADRSFGGLWPAFVVLGIGTGLVLAPSTAAAVISVPAQRAGMASATVNMFRQLGGVLGTSVLGTVLTSHFAGRLTVRASAAGGATPLARAQAFTDATHLGATLVAVVLLVMAIPAVVLVRQRPVQG